MENKINLTEKQKAILRLMRDGWKLYAVVHNDLVNYKLYKAGKAKSANFDAVLPLFREVIACGEVTKNKQMLVLTPVGSAINID